MAMVNKGTVLRRVASPECDTYAHVAPRERPEGAGGGGSTRPRPPRLYETARDTGDNLVRAGHPGTAKFVTFGT